MPYPNSTQLNATLFNKASHVDHSPLSTTHKLFSQFKTCEEAEILHKNTLDQPDKENLISLS